MKSLYNKNIQLDISSLSTVYLAQEHCWFSRRNVEICLWLCLEGTPTPLHYRFHFLGCLLCYPKKYNEPFVKITLTTHCFFIYFFVKMHKYRVSLVRRVSLGKPCIADAMDTCKDTL